MVCYILHTVLLVIILLFKIVIICYHYTKHRCRRKMVLLDEQYKMENSEFKNVSIKNQTCFYFDDIIKFEDFDFVSISLDEN